MLVGSFAVGLLPAIIKASNRIMNLISIVGAGLLVGVALIIIIPEGMLTLNEALQAKAKRLKTDRSSLEFLSSLSKGTSTFLIILMMV